MSNITLYTSNAYEVQKRLVPQKYTVIRTYGNCLKVTKGIGQISYKKISYILAKSAEQIMLIHEASALLKETHSSHKNIQAILKNLRFTLDKPTLAHIASDIEHILRQNGWLNLDGYILFRLSSERATTRKALTAIIKDTLIRHEYDRFIKNLRDYVESSAHHEAELHIIPHAGRYKLLNNQNADLTDSTLSAYLAEVPPGEVNYDDWLVGALLDLLPAKIIIHHNNKIANRNILTTIAGIFKGKVSFC